MRGLPLLVLLSLAAGCVSLTPASDVETPAATVGVDADGFTPILFDGVDFQEVDLATVEGRILHADVYLPKDPLGDAAATAPDKFPTVLLLSPYWGGGTGGRPLGYMPYDFLVKRLLPRGYAVVFGDLAGNGGSSGCWDFMGPVERKSAVDMVEAVAAQPWSDGKVGMLGISYDGMTQIMAASDQAPHLTTIVPSSPLTSAYLGLIQNGVHYGGGWHSTLTSYEQSSLLPPGMNLARVPGWTGTLQDSPQCLAANHLGDLPTNEYNDYYAARDYRALGADVKVSVFYTQGFLDPAVKPSNFGAWFDGVPTLKKAWLGQWFHQYPTAEGGGRDDMYLTIHRWFDHELKGIDNGIDKDPAMDVQDSLGRWRHESTWPPADATPLVLQLGADGALVQTGAKEGAVAFGGPTSALDIVMGDGTGSASFGELAFPKGVHMAGVPTLNLTLASDRPAGDIIARLYHGERLVSQGAFNLLFAGGLDAPQPLTPGAPVEIGLEMYPTDYVVPAGESLTLVLATQDGSGWYDSDGSLATLTLFAGETATLTLPTIERGDDAIFLTSCGRALKDEVAGCWQGLKDQGVSDKE